MNNSTTNIPICEVANPGGSPCTKPKGHDGGHDLAAYGSLTNIPILDDDAVAEIEARLKEWDGGAQHPASWNNVRALCQTVRVLRDLNKGLAKDNVNLTNEAHKAHDRWKSELHQTEMRLKAITNDRDQILVERDDALRQLRIYKNDQTPANTEYEL